MAKSAQRAQAALSSVVLHLLGLSPASAAPWASEQVPATRPGHLKEPRPPRRPLPERARSPPEPVAASRRWRLRRSPPGISTGADWPPPGRGLAAGEKAGACCGQGRVAVWAAVCRATAPVTESRPCSSTVTREYSRSRSPFRVSMAEASRRASPWLSLATAWICWACRVRSAAATWSAPPPDRKLVGEHRQGHRSNRRSPPRSEPPQRAAVEGIPFPPKILTARRRCFRCRNHCSDGCYPWPYETAAPLRPHPNHAANINRKCARILNPPPLTASNRVSMGDKKTSKRAAAQSESHESPCAHCREFG